MKVAVSTYRNKKLRLIWSYQSKQRFLSLGLEDTQYNRIIAEQKARQIEADIIAGHYDPTLNKYRIFQKGDRSDLTVADLFDKFIAYKAGRVEGRTLEKYNGLAVRIAEYFGARGADVSERDAERFQAFLAKHMKPITIRERMQLLTSAYEWGKKRGLIENNPWADLTVKVPPERRPKPFTKDEVRRIITAFREHPTYSYYADYVEFLFLTGCRTGEAIGLLWKFVDPDYRFLWIGESLSRGKRKATKTNKAREIKLSPRLQELLRDRRGDRGDEDLVFATPKGKPISDGNFRDRAWEPILLSLEIEYRKPYATRSTMVSHNLAAGRNPVEIAQITGHDPKVLYEHYAGVIASHPEIKDVY